MQLSSWNHAKERTRGASLPASGATSRYATCSGRSFLAILLAIDFDSVIGSNVATLRLIPLPRG